MTSLPTALYVPADGMYAATELTRGPWNPDHQHAGPPSALLARAVEQAGTIPGGQTARLSFDILRPVPIMPLRVDARVLRPGRRVEQVESTLSDDGEVLMRATAWRIRRDGVGGQTADASKLPGPETGDPGRFGFWPEGVAYYQALEWRFVAGRFDEPGPAAVWTRLLVPLVEGEEPTPLERLLVMADAASGVSAALPWDRWLFVNVDLGIHLERAPRGEWMAMDARTTIGPEGLGLCTSRLSDSDGGVGVSTQSLLVEPR